MAHLAYYPFTTGGALYGDKPCESNPCVFGSAASENPRVGGSTPSLGTRRLEAFPGRLRRGWENATIRVGGECRDCRREARALYRAQAPRERRHGGARAGALRRARRLHPTCRDLEDPRRARHRCSLRADVPRRGAAGRGAPSPARRPGPRRRRAGRRVLLRDGVHSRRGSAARPPAPRQDQAAPADRAPRDDHDRRGGRAPPRPRAARARPQAARPGPSRRRARQHPARVRRRHQGRRLRHRQGLARRSLRDHERRAQGQGRLHGPRAVCRRAARPPRRRLLARRHALRGGDGAPAVQGQERLPDDVGDRRAHAAASERGARRHPARARGHHHEGARARPRRPLSDRRGDAARARGVRARGERPRLGDRARGLHDRAVRQAEPWLVDDDVLRGRRRPRLRLCPRRRSPCRRPTCASGSPCRSASTLATARRSRSRGSRPSSRLRGWPTWTPPTCRARRSRRGWIAGAVRRPRFVAVVAIAVAAGGGSSDDGSTTHANNNNTSATTTPPRPAAPPPVDVPVPTPVAVAPTPVAVASPPTDPGSATPGSATATVPDPPRPVRPTPQPIQKPVRPRPGSGSGATKWDPNKLFPK